MHVVEDSEMEPDIIVMKQNGAPIRVVLPSGMSYPVEVILGRTDIARIKVDHMLEPVYVIDLSTGEQFIKRGAHYRWSIEQEMCRDCGATSEKIAAARFNLLDFCEPPR